MRVGLPRTGPSRGSGRSPAPASAEPCARRRCCTPAHRRTVPTRASAVAGACRAGRQLTEQPASRLAAASAASAPYLVFTTALQVGEHHLALALGQLADGSARPRSGSAAARGWPSSACAWASRSTGRGSLRSPGSWAGGSSTSSIALWPAFRSRLSCARSLRISLARPSASSCCSSRPGEWSRSLSLPCSYLLVSCASPAPGAHRALAARLLSCGPPHVRASAGRAALSPIWRAVAPAGPNERITRSRCLWLGVTRRWDLSLTAAPSRGAAAPSPRARRPPRRRTLRGEGSLRALELLEQPPVASPRPGAFVLAHSSRRGRPLGAGLVPGRSSRRADHVVRRPVSRRAPPAGARASVTCHGVTVSANSPPGSSSAAWLGPLPGELAHRGERHAPRRRRARARAGPAGLRSAGPRPRRR